MNAVIALIFYCRAIPCQPPRPPPPSPAENTAVYTPPGKGFPRIHGEACLVREHERDVSVRFFGKVDTYHPSV